MFERKVSSWFVTEVFIIVKTIGTDRKKPIGANEEYRRSRGLLGE